MGRLTYAGSTTYDIDDRTLRHLETITGTKLRRRETFLLSWSNTRSTGHGRTSLWMHHSIPLEFTYERSTEHTINRAWLAILMDTASTARGIDLSEHAEDRSHPDRRQRRAIANQAHTPSTSV